MTPIFFRWDGEDFALVHRAFVEGLPPEFVPLSELEAKWVFRRLRTPGQVEGMGRVLEALGSTDRVREDARLVSAQRAALMSEDHGEYVLFRWVVLRPAITLDLSEREAPEIGLAPEPPVETVEHFVEVLVVDERDQPLPGIACIVELSNGQQRAGRTDDHGLLRIEGIVPAGPCAIRFPTLDVGAIAPA